MSAAQAPDLNIVGSFDSLPPLSSPAPRPNSLLMSPQVAQTFTIPDDLAILSDDQLNIISSHLNPQADKSAVVRAKRVLTERREVAQPQQAARESHDPLESTARFTTATNQELHEPPSPVPSPVSPTSSPVPPPPPPPQQLNLAQQLRKARHGPFLPEFSKPPQKVRSIQRGRFKTDYLFYILITPTPDFVFPELNSLEYDVCRVRMIKWGDGRERIIDHAAPICPSDGDSNSYIMIRDKMRRSKTILKTRIWKYSAHDSREREAVEEWMGKAATAGPKSAVLTNLDLRESRPSVAQKKTARRSNARKYEVAKDAGGEVGPEPAYARRLRRRREKRAATEAGIRLNAAIAEVNWSDGWEGMEEINAWEGDEEQTLEEGEIDEEGDNQ